MAGFEGERDLARDVPRSPVGERPASAAARSELDRGAERERRLGAREHACQAGRSTCTDGRLRAPPHAGARPTPRASETSEETLAVAAHWPTRASNQGAERTAAKSESFRARAFTASPPRAIAIASASNARGSARR